MSREMKLVDRLALVPDHVPLRRIVEKETVRIIRRHRDDELKKLGKFGVSRAERIASWLERYIDRDAVPGLLTTAKEVRMFERLRRELDDE